MTLATAPIRVLVADDHAALRDGIAAIVGNEPDIMIRVVHSGRRYVLAEVAQEIAIHAAEDPLTTREVEILGMVAEGNANKVIARRLSLSEDTVKAHLRAGYSKLDVSDRTHAVTVALRRGISAL